MLEVFHMKEPNVKDLKKYLQGMAKLPKAKYITSERLSRIIGIYPEVINETLSYFDPMIMMDYEYNLLELVPSIKKFIEDKEAKRAPTPKPVMVKKDEVDAYENYFDFIYKKLTYGGMLDRNVNLSDKDLKILKRLISEELANRKAKK